MLANDSEPAFLNSVADWFETVEERCLCPVLTLKSTSKLTQDPITENTYEYVLIRRFQSDSIKRQISRYRQMGCG